MGVIVKIFYIIVYAFEIFYPKNDYNIYQWYLNKAKTINYVKALKSEPQQQKHHSIWKGNPPPSKKMLSELQRLWPNTKKVWHTWTWNLQRREQREWSMRNIWRNDGKKLSKSVELYKFIVMGGSAYPKQ